jgi:exodeoxyribonuclease-3
MRLVTWNVNSLRARKDRALAFLARHAPDVVCLQELKGLEADLPLGELEAAGYRVAAHGQKTYNGVAILSRETPTAVTKGFPGDPDPAQSRYLAADVAGVRVVNLYVPNGQEVGSPKYEYKLAWLAALRAHLAAAVDATRPWVICGDFNIAPDDRDVYDVEKLKGTVLCSDPEREAFRALLALGFADGLRLKDDAPARYTWWDYRGAMFRRGLGLRIDHVLVTPPLAARLAAVEIDLEERKGEGPSDHAPVTAVFADPT